MSEQDWDRFFELVDKIVHTRGTWQDKSADLISSAEDRDSIDAWNELVSWYTV